MEPLPVTVVHYPEAATLEAFAVDDDGRINVASKHNNEPWTRLDVGAAGFALPGSPLGAAHHPPGKSLEAFLSAPHPGFAGSDQGAIYLIWKSPDVDAMRWHDPFPLTHPASCPVPLRAVVSAVHHPVDESLEAFFVDSDGRLHVISKRGHAPWAPLPTSLSGHGLARPGAPVASASHPPGRSLEVFVAAQPVGFSRASIYLAWKSADVDGGSWHLADALTDPATCPLTPGAHLTAVHEPFGGTLEVLFVDARGAVNVLFKQGTGPWELPPTRITADGFAPPGAPIAAARYAKHEQLEVAVAGHRNVLLLWKHRNEPWKPLPVELTEGGSTPAGVPLSIADHPPVDTLEVLLGDPEVFARVIWKHENGVWRPCAMPIAPRFGTSVPPPPVQTTRVMPVTGGPKFRDAHAEGVDLGASTTHQGFTYVFFGDVPQPSQPPPRPGVEVQPLPPGPPSGYRRSTPISSPSPRAWRPTRSTSNRSWDRAASSRRSPSGVQTCASAPAQSRRPPAPSATATGPTCSSWCTRPPTAGRSRRPAITPAWSHTSRRPPALTGPTTTNSSFGGRQTASGRSRPARRAIRRRSASIRPGPAASCCSAAALTPTSTPEGIRSISPGSPCRYRPRAIRSTPSGTTTAETIPTAGRGTRTPPGRSGISRRAIRRCRCCTPRTPAAGSRCTRARSGIPHMALSGPEPRS
jgi:hypothetical protein